MLSDSREYPSTDHALRVLVRIDTQLRLACLEVRGCLTSTTYATLANILTHTGALGAGVRVNLLRAEHIEGDALQHLRGYADAAVDEGARSAHGTTYSSGPAESVPVEILVPDTLPVCRLGHELPAVPLGRPAFPGHALTNAEAAERAFLLRDPRVLADRPSPDTGSHSL
ncbi:hypothetical protein ABIB35_002188 [Arthrobacter sp. UYP6]|uniref:hypothetical protein n=1 Tax=Arthrobacter sp. UYP6 TaxID=1756378 RepID=UPI0033990616